MLGRVTLLYAAGCLFPPRLRLRCGFGWLSGVVVDDSLLNDLIIDDTESETLLPSPGDCVVLKALEFVPRDLIGVACALNALDLAAVVPEVEMAC